MSNPAGLEELPPDKRARKRSRVLLAARLKTGDGTMKANLLNLSPSGAQLDAASPPEVGAKVTLLRGAIEARGRVVWINQNRFGIAFDHQIDESLVLEHIRSTQSPNKVIPFP